MSATSRPVITVLPSADAVAAAAAERIVAAASAAIQDNGSFVLALAGGDTPRMTYERLAAPPVAARVSWPHVLVVWSDERCVPPDDPASNFRMARESLLDRVPLPAANVHRVHGEEDPRAAATAYEATLRRLFATPTGPPRTAPGARLDLALLGLGEDGHTASLFPGSDALEEEAHWTALAQAGQGASRRITLTLPVLNAAAEVLFLVTGRRKAAIVRRVLASAPQSPALPAQRIAPVPGRFHWLLDAEAASQIDSLEQGGR